MSRVGWWMVMAVVCASAGCVGPRAIEGTTRAQREAIERLERSYAADYGALERAVDALLEIRVARVRLGIETEIVSRYVTAGGEADVDALAQDVDAARAGVLVEEVRAGRMTRAEVEGLVRDYAASSALRDGEAYRRALVSRLWVVRGQEEGARALRGAMAERRSEIGLMFAEALAGSAGLEGYAKGSVEAGRFAREAARQAWEEFVVSGVEGEERKEEVRRVIARLLRDSGSSMSRGTVDNEAMR